jgi:2-iminobutanoate/2-iminopropanoate deaminase
MSGKRRHIVLPRPPGARWPFSDAVLVGDTLYVSGNIGLNPETGKPGGTPEDEARLVMDSFKRAVEAGGMAMDDLVWVQIFCTDLATFETFNGVYQKYFKAELPARAFLGTDKLLFGARYEVTGIAVKRGS